MNNQSKPIIVHHSPHFSAETPYLHLGFSHAPHSSPSCTLKQIVHSITHIHSSHPHILASTHPHIHTSSHRHIAPSPPNTDPCAQTSLLHNFVLVGTRANTFTRREGMCFISTDMNARKGTQRGRVQLRGFRDPRPGIVCSWMDITDHTHTDTQTHNCTHHLIPSIRPSEDTASCVLGSHM